MPIEDVKHKIMQGRGSSNINLGIFVCSFEVCPPLMFAFDVCLYTNYGVTDHEGVLLDFKFHLFSHTVWALGLLIYKYKLIQITRYVFKCCSRCSHYVVYCGLHSLTRTLASCN